MASFTWEFGAEGAGLHFSITYDDSTGEFKVSVFEGAFNLNALYLSGAGQTGNYLENGDEWNKTKSDNSLNMNGANTVWDDGETDGTYKDGYDLGFKLSDAGLGHGTDWYLEAGDDPDNPTTKSFSFPGLTIDDNTVLGVRATSVDEFGSIKWVDTAPEVSQDIENAPPEDIFLSVHDELVGKTDTGSNTGEGTIIAKLHVYDPDDAPETFGLDNFRIVNPDDPTDTDFDHPLLEIADVDGAIVLKLKDNTKVSQGDDNFSVKIEVTDSVGNTYDETFNFVIGTSQADNGGDGNQEKPALVGEETDDVIFGFQNGDVLRGGDNDDILLGGLGDDTLIGGPGADTLVGNDGNDTFVWEAGDMVGTNADHPEGRYDTIVDWGNTHGNGENTLDLSGLLASFGYDSDDHDLDDWVNVSEGGGDTIVAVDPDGEGGAGAGGWLNLVKLLGVTDETQVLQNIVHE